MHYGQVQDVAAERYSLVVHNVEFSVSKRRGNFVLYYLDSHPVAGYVLAVFDLPYAADVQADRRVKFQGVAAGGGFRVAKHDADFHSDLVYENDRRVGFIYNSRQFPQRLAHKPGLQADVGIAHLSLEFRSGYESRHRVDDDKIHRVGTH